MGEVFKRALVAVAVVAVMFGVMVAMALIGELFNAWF